MTKLTQGLCGIYLIENTKTNKSYIGQSRAIQIRWKQHLLYMNHGNKEVAQLADEWAKYGATAFRFSILEIVKDPRLLEERERYWMDRMGADRLYNRRTGIKKRTQISVHLETKERLEALGCKSLNEAIESLLE